MDDMILFSAKVNWYNEYDEKDENSIVVGFSKSLSDFAERINNEFSYINTVTIACENSWATQNELLYVTSETLDDIQKENGY